MVSDRSEEDCQNTCARPRRVNWWWLCIGWVGHCVDYLDIYLFQRHLCSKNYLFFVIEAVVSFVCWAQPELGAVETRQRVVHSRAGVER